MQVVATLDTSKHPYLYTASKPYFCPTATKLRQKVITLLLFEIGQNLLVLPHLLPLHSTLLYVCLHPASDLLKRKRAELI